jgi:hypothetical protein
MSDVSGSREVEALLHRYIDLFNAEDFEAAFECYRMPFTWLFGATAVTVTSRDEFLAMMTASKASLRKKGLGKSRLTKVIVRMMDEHVALAGVAVVRVRPDGSELETIGGTYMVHNDGQGWRLVGHGTHSVDAIVPAWTS